MSFISYAQNLEDVMLQRALSHVEEGFYVDVGANDPTCDSVTRAFYDRGWTGINVEPDKKYYNKLVECRPRDTNIQLLIGERACEKEFYTTSIRGLSTAIRHIANQYIEAGQEVVSQKIKQIPLTKLFETYVNREVHFLKIDVEGMEKAVLDGMDFVKYRPWILLIESIDPITRQNEYDAWEPLILGSGYEHVYSDGINRYYIAVEKMELKNYFQYPPNTFDNYCAYRDISPIEVNNARLTEDNAELTVEKRALENMIRSMEQKIKRLTEDLRLIRSESTEQIADLRKRMAVAQEEMVEARAKIEALEKKLQVVAISEKTKSEKLQKAGVTIAEYSTKIKHFETELLDTKIFLEHQARQIKICKSNNDGLAAQLAHSEATIQLLSKQSSHDNNEIARLRGLLYSATIGAHLYRAWRVLLGDRHYCQPKSAQRDGNSSQSRFQELLAKLFVFFKPKPSSVAELTNAQVGSAGSLSGSSDEISASIKEPRELLITHNNKRLPPSAPRMLVLSTYPFQRPRHGGQLRLANIVQAYQENGWYVQTIAIYDSAQPADVGSCDILFPQDSPFRLNEGDNIPFIADLQAGFYATGDAALYDKILSFLPEKLDAIHVEQPWLWPLAVKLKALPVFKSLVLINGTQNVEWMLKKSIFATYGIVNDRIIATIKELELRACGEADITLAVTQQDLNYFSPYIQKESLLAPNGVTPWKASQAKLNEWRDKLPKGPWLLYIASAHPPNFTGFLDCIGDSLAAIPPDGKLVVAGSVCEHIYRVMAATRWHSLNLSRLQLLFELEPEDINAVRSLAWAYLLPISDGGGSNLKTAEALAAGTSVIGSRQAYRGFEDYADAEGVHICNTPTEFQKAIREVCSASKPYRITPDEKNKRSQLYWDQCLKALPELVSAVMAQHN